MNYLVKISLLLTIMPVNHLLATELTINLAGQEKSGTLFLAIYDNSEAYQQAIDGEGKSSSDESAYYQSKTSLGVKDAHELIVDIPDGTYALVLFIDTNKNGKFDKNFIGIPKEQYGFSNNAMGKLSAPTFEQAKFKIAGKTIQNIKLK